MSDLGSSKAAKVAVAVVSVYNAQLNAQWLVCRVGSTAIS